MAFECWVPDVNPPRLASAMNRGDTWGGNFCASRLIRDGGSSSVSRFFVVGTLFRTKQKGDEAAEALIRSTRCSLRCFHRFALSFFISPGKMSFPSSALLTKNLRTPFIHRKFKSLVTYMFFTSSILFTSSELKMVQPLRGVGAAARKVGRVHRTGTIGGHLCGEAVLSPLCLGHAEPRAALWCGCALSRLAIGHGS